MMKNYVKFKENRLSIWYVNRKVTIHSEETKAKMRKPKKRKKYTK